MFRKVMARLDEPRSVFYRQVAARSRGRASLGDSALPLL